MITANYLTWTIAQQIGCCAPPISQLPRALQVSQRSWRRTQRCSAYSWTRAICSGRYEVQQRYNSLLLCFSCSGGNSSSAQKKSLYVAVAPWLCKLPPG